jgi:hypothetical protein
MKTKEILKSIRNLDFVEGKNITDIAKQYGWDKNLLAHVINEIKKANQHGSKKNDYSGFVFIDGSFIGIYNKFGKKLKEIYND